MDALRDARIAGMPVVVLGGGSNVVLTGDLDACVLLMEIPGYDVTQDDEAWLVTAGAGAGTRWSAAPLPMACRGWKTWR